MPAHLCRRYMRSSPSSGFSSQTGRTASSMINDIRAKDATPVSRIACLRTTQISRLAGGSTASVRPQAASAAARTPHNSFIGTTPRQNARIAGMNPARPVLIVP
ncbi:hypothetical protein Z046_31140 [Pseudomonas aeruginosa VRFPA09]|nr:hypothetical protein Z046_31140 [Pseudomonas aeruginosa VRFPA09]